jgi:hypothetical protein
MAELLSTHEAARIVACRECGRLTWARSLKRQFCRKKCTDANWDATATPEQHGQARKNSYEKFGGRWAAGVATRGCRPDPLGDVIAVDVVGRPGVSGCVAPATCGAAADVPAGDPRLSLTCRRDPIGSGGRVEGPARRRRHEPTT